MGLIGYVGAYDGRALDKRRGGLLLGLSFFFGVITSLLVVGTAAAYFGRLLARWSAKLLEPTMDGVTSVSSFPLRGVAASEKSDLQP